MTAEGFGIGLRGFAGQSHDERQRRKEEDHAGEDGEGVLVAEHGGLAEHLLVGLGRRPSARPARRACLR